MKILNIKKISWKVAAIVVASVLVVAGAVSIYYQVRTIALINSNSVLMLQQKTNNAADTCNAVFTNALYRVGDMRNMVESGFKIDKYKNGAESYFNDEIKSIMDTFIFNTTNSADYIQAAYFALDPDLAGFPLVSEIFYNKTDGGIVHGDPQTYEDYMQKDSEDMNWFYGAFGSGEPYWTHVYVFDGVLMVSYVEPVFIGGVKVGVVGVDLSINGIVNVVNGIEVFDTGFAVLLDNYNEILESNDFINRLASSDRGKLAAMAGDGIDEVADAEISGALFKVAHRRLVNGYNVLIFAPEAEYNAEIKLSFIRFAVIFPLCIVIVVIISGYIGKSFSKPLSALSAIMIKASATGDIVFSPEDDAALRKYAENRDETGQTIVSFTGFVDRINKVSHVLETISTGDLTNDLLPLSDRDVMGNSLCDMSAKLNEMFNDINQSASQVSAGAKQIADGAQSLASGATEQAASIQELSASISEIAEHTKLNASMAGNAAKLANDIMNSAVDGSRQMGEMMAAVNEISEASSSIGKVIKVIDDIAFQTNVLALNAAVEAARAGQYGKGFAVVAEEVRSLAAKSAEAAKDTGALIENSIEKATLGVSIASETASSLEEIVAGVNDSNKIAVEIASASEEQLRGIEQINSSVEQVAGVVQHNSATAEESAAASEEMSSQSATLRSLMTQFKLKNAGASQLRPPSVYLS